MAGKGEGEERSGARGGCIVSYRPDGNRVAKLSVRFVVIVKPEHEQFAAKFLPFSSYSAVVMEQQELASNPDFLNVEGQRSL